MSEANDLERFIKAQDPVYGRVLDELRAGSKEGHWMWFIFPQLKGLGHSQLATFYGISSRDEAEAYLQHPVLGPRLRECTELVNRVTGQSLEEILGYPDDLKFRSCMTLFSIATIEDDIFQQALDKYFGGEPDERTVDLLKWGRVM